MCRNAHLHQREPPRSWQRGFPREVHLREEVSGTFLQASVSCRVLVHCTFRGGEGVRGEKHPRPTKGHGDSSQSQILYVGSPSSRGALGAMRRVNTVKLSLALRSRRSTPRERTGLHIISFLPISTSSHRISHPMPDPLSRSLLRRTS